MKARISENKLIEIFFACDDFCQIFYRDMHLLGADFFNVQEFSVITF